jgi:hypothetical protein
VLPLNNIYKQDIFDAIKAAVVKEEENKKETRLVSYREIYRRVIQILGRKISYRDFQRHIENMVHDNILYKYDPTGSRGSKVSFSLTGKARRKDNLNILGIDERVQRRKRLYQLLLFYDQYKRRPLLTEKQLDRFLRKIGFTLKDLEKFSDIQTADNISTVLFKDLKGVGIVRHIQYNPKTGSQIDGYYTFIPGFTITEFVSYLKKIKQGKDPHPFSTYFPRIYIPFVNYLDYEEEVADVISKFREDGLIQPINQIFPGEIRFDIADKSLKALSMGVWWVYTLDFDLLTGRLVYKGKPKDEDKNYLRLIYGKQAADALLVSANLIRRRYLKENSNNNSSEEVESEENFTQQLENTRQAMVQTIIKVHKKVIQENEVARELIEGICFLPFLSKISKAG